MIAALSSIGGSLDGVSAAVLAATGPVGQRAARLLCGLGAKVSVGSRSLDRAAALADSLGKTTSSTVTPFAATAPTPLRSHSTTVLSLSARGPRV